MNETTGTTETAGSEEAAELVRAAEAGDEPTVAGLLRRGVTTDARGSGRRTALDLAVYRGRDGVVALLLAAGADPEQIVGPYQEELPLVRAATRGDIGIVRRLIAAGADPNRPNRYRATALGRAGAEGRTETARLLLEHGADPRQTWKDKTPAEWATQCGHPETAALLRT